MENKDQNIFIKVFAKLMKFLKTKNVSQENENEALIEFALSKEDDAEHKDNPDPLTADDILEICKSVDYTNETIKKWYDEGKTNATNFGAKEISELAKEIDPSISEKDIEREIQKTVDYAVEESAIEFADNIAGEKNELSDENLNEINEQTNGEED